jgi:hypothetical protein
MLCGRSPGEQHFNKTSEELRVLPEQRAAEGLKHRPLHVTEVHVSIESGTLLKVPSA